MSLISAGSISLDSAFNNTQHNPKLKELCMNYIKIHLLPLILLLCMASMLAEDN
jgi:hypothetical protein